MKIVADRDIYRIEETFSSAGELVLLPGREIDHSHVVNADALIVRTTTLVDNSLFENSTLQFVALKKSFLFVGLMFAQEFIIMSISINLELKYLNISFSEEL